MAAVLHIVSNSPLLDYSSAISRLRMYRAEQKRHFKRGPLLDLETPLLNDNLLYLCNSICSFRKCGSAKLSKEIASRIQPVVRSSGQDYISEPGPVLAFSKDV